MALWQFFDMTNCLTSWRMLHLLTSWRTFWTPWNFLTTSHTFLTSSLTLVTRFLSSWHNFLLFCEQNIMKTCFYVINEVFFMRLWRIFDIPFDTITYFLNFISKRSTHFWRHSKPIDVITCFWHCIMVLTSWCTLWRFDVIKLSWRHKHRHNQIHTNISEWWCGQTMLGWYHVCPKHTNNHSIIYNRPILIGIILAIIKMHDSLYKNPLSPPSRMLANKHVLYFCGNRCISGI